MSGLMFGSYEEALADLLLCVAHATAKRLLNTIKGHVRVHGFGILLAQREQIEKVWRRYSETEPFTDAERKLMQWLLNSVSGANEWRSANIKSKFEGPVQLNCLFTVLTNPTVLIRAREYSLLTSFAYHSVPPLAFYRNGSVAVPLYSVIGVPMDSLLDVSRNVTSLRISLDAVDSWNVAFCEQILRHFDVVVPRPNVMQSIMSRAFSAQLIPIVDGMLRLCGAVWPTYVDKLERKFLESQFLLEAEIQIANDQALVTQRLNATMHNLIAAWQHESGGGGAIDAKFQYEIEKQSRHVQVGFHWRSEAELRVVATRRLGKLRLMRKMLKSVVLWHATRIAACLNSDLELAAVVSYMTPTGVAEHVGECTLARICTLVHNAKFT